MALRGGAPYHEPASPPLESCIDLGSALVRSVTKQYSVLHYSAQHHLCTVMFGVGVPLCCMPTACCIMTALTPLTRSGNGISPGLTISAGLSGLCRGGR